MLQFEPEQKNRKSHTNNMHTLMQINISTKAVPKKKKTALLLNTNKRTGKSYIIDI